MMICRQWEVTPVTEDVPEMTEDVPVPGAEGLAGDGAEGSAIDDAEGFSGGPRDPSVLTSFAEHVAHSIWNGEERPELKLVSHGRKVEKLGRPAPGIEGLVAATGLTPLIACSVVTGDRGVISTFVERWHKETSNFHLLVRELTITLDDVASLLHLPIIGAFHSFEPLHVDEAIIMLVELLECHGAYVHLSWLRDIYQRRCEARQWIVAARAYLLHLVGCTLFANKSATHVHVVHLDVFRDLAQSGTYAWGVATLAHMYDQLNEASQSTSRQIAGYVTLLQCWIYKHFPGVHNSVIDDGYDETSPRACWWLTTKAYMKGLSALSYKTCIDALTVPDVCWMPYGDHRGVRAFDLISCFQVSLPLGLHLSPLGPSSFSTQGLCPSPLGPSPFSTWAFSLYLANGVPLWSHFDQRGWCDNLATFKPSLHRLLVPPCHMRISTTDHLAVVGQICLVPGQVSRDYMEWFFPISHSFITPTQATDQPRHQHVPQHEAYVEPDILEVLVAAEAGPSQAADPPPPRHTVDACEAIAKSLERMLNLRTVTEGTELHEIMEDCLRITRGVTSDGNVYVRVRRRWRTDHS
ncbi:Protein MAIN-LIKE 2 [Glycine soja]